MTDEKREKAKVRAQEWRAANRERHREYSRKYRPEHKEECAAKNKKWAKEHSGLVQEYHRKSRASNPEAYRDITRRYRASHPGFSANRCAARRARLRGAEGDISQQEWDGLVLRFGGRCVKCGRLTKLSMDHIVPLSLGGSHTVDNIQPMCIPCNSSKGATSVDYRQVALQNLSFLENHPHA